MAFVSVVSFDTFSPNTALPSQATIRLWASAPFAGVMELASKTVPTVTSAGTAMATFQLPDPPAPAVAFTVHAGTSDLPNALLRSGSLASQPPGATPRTPSALIGPPASLTQADLSQQVAAVFANGPLQFSQPIVSTFLGSLTAFIEVDSGSLTGLNPQTQQLSLSFSGQVHITPSGPRIGYTATLDAAVSGSRDPLNPADIVVVGVVPGSLHFEFTPGSFVDAPEAELLNVLQTAFDEQISAQISQMLSSHLNAALAQLTLSALRSTALFQSLPALPPAIVISLAQPRSSPAFSK